MLFCFDAQWVVMVVEVKPSLLSGGSKRLLLKEITQVILKIQFESSYFVPIRKSSSSYFYSFGSILNKYHTS